MTDVVILGRSRSSTDLALIRCMGNAGYGVVGYFVREMKFVLKSRYLTKYFLFDSVKEAVDAMLRDYPVSEDRPFLMLGWDVAAYEISLRQNEFEKRFVVSSLGKQNQVAFWMDKRNQMALARKHGLNVPWMKVLSKGDAVPEGIEYPVFTKGLVSAIDVKNDEAISYCEEDLRKRLDNLKCDRCFVMSYIRKKKEINFFGFAVKGRVYIDYRDCADRFPKDAYGNYATFSLAPHDELHARLVEMIKEMDYEGLFEIEFLLDQDEEMNFMEINLRADSFIWCLTAGQNQPALWCRLMQLPEEQLPDKLDTGRKRFTGMVEERDFREAVLGGQISVIKWLWQFLTAKRHQIVNLKDPLPAIWYVAEMLDRRIRIKVLQKG